MVLCLLLTAVLLSSACAEIVNFAPNYRHGLRLEYDEEMFTLEDTFDENGEVHFTYDGETALPVYMTIHCYYDADQADVDWEITSAFEREGRDAIIGNYLDAMGYYDTSDEGGIERRRYVYIFSFLEDVFAVDIYEYEGIPENVSSAVSTILNSLELGGA